MNSEKRKLFVLILNRKSSFTNRNIHINSSETNTQSSIEEIKRKHPNKSQYVCYSSIHKSKRVNEWIVFVEFEGN